MVNGVAMKKCMGNKEGAGSYNHLYWWIALAGHAEIQFYTSLGIVLE